MRSVLCWENNQAAGKTWVWAYDDAGNITSRKEYAYTTGSLGSVLSTVNYTYGDSFWGDLLTGWNGETITSDTIGNMLSDGTWNYTWEHGRQLATLSDGSTTWSFAYDADGMRTSRSNGSRTYNYVYNGSSLSQMTVGGNTLYFAYDASGTPLSVTYNGTNYYYATNLQGDVTAILNTSGTAVVQYTYDAWGKLLTTTGSMASGLGVHNPLRYRGYVYDTETQLYYLQSRYYNPEMGRFICSDIAAATGQGILGNNTFAYCGNNPVCRADDGGYFWDIVFDVASLIVSVVEVVQNPSDVGAWVGLALDIVDVAIPCVGGLGEVADAVNAARKVSNAVDNAHDMGKITDVAHMATKGTPNDIGKIGEKLAGIDPKAKVSIQVNGRTRIPDALTDNVLTEVKNVKYISNTQQLRDFATYAKATNRSMDLYVRPSTKIAQTVIDAGWNIKYLW